MAGELVIAHPSPIDSLDPHLAASDDARVVVRRVFEPLLRRDPATLRPAPGLATSCDRVGATSWRLVLRDGVRFSDGSPLDARAVVANLERIADPASGSRFLSTLGPVVASADAPDVRTVRIETRHPYAPLPERLCSLGVAALAQGAPMAGSGPYRVAASGDGAIELARNERYTGDPPFFARVRYRHLSREQGAQALLDGEVDAATDLPLGMSARLGAAGIATAVAAAPNVLELRMDALGRGGPTPFTDRRVRRAVAHAVDCARIALTVLEGRADPVATSVVPTMFGHDPEVRAYAHDPARARSLLAEAGYPDGFTTVFHWLPASLWPNTKGIVEAIASDLAAVGIRTELVSVSAKEMSQRTKSGRAGPLFIRNNPNGGAHDGAFAFFYLRERFPYAYYWSPQLEELVVAAESELDPGARASALARAQRLLHEESPYVWLFRGAALAGASRALDLRAALVGPELHPEELRPTTA